MRLIVAGQEACTPDEFEELAFGIDAELFTGTDDESEQERAARLAAARDILSDLRPDEAWYARRLLRGAERRRVLTWKAAA
ncbi:hypothetical protein P3T37_002238 [Kitasatospora sp. MAA4]|uniref:hypothetical protein n=1 Tax=Kitasatospora sp. MAA4 TaxID=3035093 RepID=UPI0024755F18|nr:hypothetical protein [Kitasatospora sp. MAA4]MDH6132852.1 hypothetical protein [Kitasatospora sp. MAA4]